MPQTMLASVDATTLEGAKQTIALGPVASQVAIKQLGTNGGGISFAKSASDATDFFQIPTGRVVEVGTQVTV
jgi:K+-transporting ATPase A subunit